MGLLMRLFVIYHSRDKATSIMEVEAELIHAVEDPSIMWLPPTEYKIRILEPVSLYEKTPRGHLEAPIWYSHSLYGSMDKARAAVETQIREGFERDLRKFGIGYTEQQIQEKLSQVQEVRLK